MKVTSMMLPLMLTMALANGAETNPLQKVIQMVGDLQAELIGEGATSQKLYSEFSAMCEKRSQELHFEIKTGKGQVQSLKASIEKGTADGQALETKISDSASDVSEDEAELSEATSIRKGEHGVYSKLEKELISTVDMLERAMSIVEKEMNGGAFLQTQAQHSAQNLVQALRTMLEASSVGFSDGDKLTALIQSQSSDEDSDAEDEVGAPAASATENQSGGIVSTLQGLLEKAESQLDKARKQEAEAAQGYAMKKQSLETSGGLAKKEMSEAKSGLAGTQEKKATNEGDLTATTKDLQEDLKELEELHHACLSKASDFEEETKSRGEELGALAQAKKILTETTGGASDQAYIETSFMQVASKAKLSSESSALRIVRHLAYNQHSATLTQLASRIQSTLRLGGADGESPFKKVQGMITDMLASLEKEAEAEAGEKQYCDKEMSETTEKLDDKTDEVESLSTKIAQMEGTSEKLKGEVSVLQNELAALAKVQGEMDQLRQKENAAYKASRPEMERGLNGVKKALKVLKEYYAKPALLQEQSGSEGANAILGLLEVAESDFSKLLAEMIAEEEQAQAAYDEGTNENTVAGKTKEQDVKYKTKEAAGLDKSTTELKGDLSGVSDELSAIKDYDKQIKGRCVAKPPSYEETKKRREAEIAGLKEALTTLDGSSFLQETVTHRTLRGISRA
jgi:DNA repair exonuclease SbcCD ATPase subunit